MGRDIGKNQDEKKQERIVLLMLSATDDLGMEQITKINELYDSDEIPEQLRRSIVEMPKMSGANESEFHWTIRHIVHRQILAPEIRYFLIRMSAMSNTNAEGRINIFYLICYDPDVYLNCNKNLVYLGKTLQ